MLWRARFETGKPRTQPTVLCRMASASFCGQYRLLFGFLRTDLGIIPGRKLLSHFCWQSLVVFRLPLAVPCDLLGLRRAWRDQILFGFDLSCSARRSAWAKASSSRALSAAARANASSSRALTASARSLSALARANCAWLRSSLIRVQRNAAAQQNKCQHGGGHTFEQHQAALPQLTFP